MNQYNLNQVLFRLNTHLCTMLSFEKKNDLLSSLYLLLLVSAFFAENELRICAAAESTNEYGTL